VSWTQSELTRSQLTQSRHEVGAPHDELGEDVEDGLASLSGRVLHCQQNGTDLGQHIRRC